MFKLVVLSVVLAVVAAKPSGVLHHGVAPVAYNSAWAAAPASYSYQTRTDVVAAAPAVAAYASAPVAVAAPAVATYAAAPVVASSGVSYQSRTDFVSKPVVAAAYAAAAPAVATYAAAPIAKVAVAPAAVSYQTRTDVVHKPVVAAAYAAPAVAAYAAPVASVAVAPAPAAYAAVPVTGTALSKTVHYAEKNVVTGYSSQIYKPNLGALATPLQSVSTSHVLAPARTVATYTPTVTRVEPEVHVNKVAVDVAVPHPVVSEVEVRTPTVHAAPAVATYAAPAVATYAAAPAYAAPAIARYAAAPAASAWASYAAPVTGYSYSINAAAPVAPAAVAYNQAGLWKND